MQDGLFSLDSWKTSCMLCCCCKYVVAAQAAQNSTAAVAGGEPVLSFHRALRAPHFHHKVFLPSFQGNFSRNCCHLPILQKTPPFYTAQKNKNIHEFSAPKANIMCWCWSWARLPVPRSPLPQQCKAWMPLHRFMSPAPKIAQALKDTFRISCSQTSGWERSYFRLSCCSSIRREVQAAAIWSPGQNKACRFETLLSQSLSNILLALPHFPENFSHILLPMLFTPSPGRQWKSIYAGCLIPSNNPNYHFC